MVMIIPSAHLARVICGSGTLRLHLQLAQRLPAGSTKETGNKAWCDRGAMMLSCLVASGRKTSSRQELPARKGVPPPALGSWKRFGAGEGSLKPTPLPESPTPAIHCWPALFMPAAQGHHFPIANQQTRQPTTSTIPTSPRASEDGMTCPSIVIAAPPTPFDLVRPSLLGRLETKTVALFHWPVPPYR